MALLRRLACLLLILLPALAPVAQAQGTFYLRDGDRVVFYGDSITDQRLYTTDVEAYVVTRFPRMNVAFIHSGVGGDRVTGGGAGPIDLRLDRDVIAYKPTVMTIMLGMNDASYRPFDENIYTTYTNGYRHIIEKVKSALPNIRITVIDPSPFDDVTRAPSFEGGYNAVLVRYGQFVKDLGQQDNLTFADLNTPVVAMLEKAKAADPTLAQKIIPDRVHPGPGGHLIMAEAILKAWNAPALVSNVEIDAAGKTVAHADNTQVKSLDAQNGALRWTQADRALPLPLDMSDATLALAVNSSDFVEALDQETLKVTGLTAANYALKIDGDTVGTFTKEQLAEGVNLALLPTPMHKQAAQVLMLTNRHNSLHFTRWRQVQVPLAGESSPSLQKALNDLDALEASFVKEQRAAAQPKPHQYELTPQ